MKHVTRKAVGIVLTASLAYAAPTTVPQRTLLLSMMHQAQCGG